MKLTSPSSQHLIGCLSAIGLSIVAPCIIPSALFAGGAVAVGGLAGNILANVLQKKLSERETDPALPDINHDMHRVIGQAVSAEIGQFGRDHASTLGDQLPSIETFARRSDAELISIFLDSEFLGIVPPDAMALLVESRKDTPLPPVGKLEDWKTLVHRLTSKCLVILSPDVESQIAERLHTQLWESIRKALKRDFAGDGAGYAALHLQFMGDVLNRLDALAQPVQNNPDSITLTPELLEVLLKHKQTYTDPKAQQIIGKLSSTDKARLSSLVQRIDQLSTHLDRIFRKLLDEVRAADRALRGRDILTHSRLKWTLAGVVSVIILGGIAYVSIYTRQSEQFVATTRTIAKVDDVKSELKATTQSLDAFRIEATAIVNRYLAANEQLSKTITDRNAEIQKVASALREAQVAADGGDALAEAALAEVRKIGDLKLLQENIARIADEQYSKAEQRFEEHQARFIKRCREVATLAYLRGDMDGAKTRVDRILEINADDLDAIDRLGDIYQIQGNLSGAEKQYNRLLTLASSNSDYDQDVRAVALGGLGAIAQTRSNPDAAEKFYNASLAINRKLHDLEGQGANLNNLGYIAEFRGDMQGAEKFYNESLSIFQSLGAAEQQATIFVNLGNSAQTRSDTATAEIRYNSALSIFRKLGSLDGEALCLSNLALSAQARGDLDTAEKLHTEALAISRKLGRLEFQANNLNGLGIIAQTRSNLDDAEKLFKEALAIDRGLGRLEGQANALNNLGNCERIRGDVDAAETFIKEATAINHKIGRPEGEASDLNNLGNISQYRGDLAAAESYYKQALSIHQKLGALEAQANQLGNLGTIAQVRGDLDAAEKLYREALAIHRKLGTLEGQAMQLGNLGTISYTRGDLTGAEKLDNESLSIYGKIGSLEGSARQYANLGLIAESRKDFTQARHNWTQSRDFYAKSGITPMVEQVQGWLDGLPPN